MQACESDLTSGCSPRHVDGLLTRHEPIADHGLHLLLRVVRQDQATTRRHKHIAPDARDLDHRLDADTLVQL
jgi:hypothetical protein